MPSESASGKANIRSRRIPTVTGEVEPSELGVTLPHEHVIHQACLHSGKPDNLCIEVALVARELIAFRKSGGSTICDVTPLGLGRDPAALQEVSRQSGVQIVSGLGLYQTETWPKPLRTMSEQELADALVREAHGAESDVRAGIIGEVASHNEPEQPDWRAYRLTDDEARLFRAVAQVQRRTGLPVSTHASLGRPGVQQLRTLVEAGADPQHVVIGHCDAQMSEDIETDFEYYTTLLNEGAWIAFDLFGWDELMPDSEQYRRVAALVQEGQAKRILISTDTCRLSHLHHYGGRGFDFLFTSVLPGLRAQGVSQEDLHQMTVANPCRMLS